MSINGQPLQFLTDTSATLSTLNPNTCADPLPRSKHTKKSAGISNNPQIFSITQPLMPTHGNLTERYPFLALWSCTCKYNREDLFHNWNYKITHTKGANSRAPEDSSIHNEAVSALDIFLSTRLYFLCKGLGTIPHCLYEKFHWYRKTNQRRTY